MKRFLILTLLFSLPSCATMHEVNKSTIDLGMSANQVEKSFGKGELVKVTQQGNSRIEVYKYFTQMALSRFYPSKWLYVAYIDGQVAGFEMEEIYYRSSRPQGGTMQYHNLTTGEMGTVYYY